jgi:hypothetical protein
MYAVYAKQHPGKAAALATSLLGSANVRDQQRGVEVAAALRGADRCAVCGRALRVPGSREAGIGPECMAKREAARALTALREAGFEVLDPSLLALDDDTEEPVDG